MIKLVRQESWGLFTVSEQSILSVIIFDIWLSADFATAPTLYILNTYDYREQTVYFSFIYTYVVILNFDLSRLMQILLLAICRRCVST